MRPAASASRTRVELTGAPAGMRGATASAVKARATQRLDVAAARLPETESLADHHVLRPQRVHQDPLDERLRVDAREPRVEAQHAEFVDPRRRDALRLVAQPHQPRRRRAGGKCSFGWGSKQTTAVGQPQLAAAFPECRQDRLVPEMQAVEVADRDRAPGVRVTTGLETASNQHGPAGSGIVPRNYRCFRSRGRAPASASTPK